MKDLPYGMDQDRQCHSSHDCRNQDVSNVLWMPQSQVDQGIDSSKEKDPAPQKKGQRCRPEADLTNLLLVEVARDPEG